MANYNKVILAGNLTRDPQLTYLPSSTPVVEFGMAINRYWTGQDGQRRDETCFIDMRAYGKQAETISQYMAKGRAMLIEGRLQLQQWVAQDGTKRSKHIVIVENFQFLGNAGNSTQGVSNTSAGTGSAVSNQSVEAPAEEDISQVPPSDDDIPF